MKNDAVLTTSTTGKAEEAFVSRAEYDALKRENAELNQKLDFLMGQLRLAKKRMFGASSEQAAEQPLGNSAFSLTKRKRGLPEKRKRPKPLLWLPIPGRSVPAIWTRFCRRALPLRLWSTVYQKLNGSAMPAAR